MGFWKKVKQVTEKATEIVYDGQKDAIAAAQAGVEHAAKEAISEIKPPIKITMDQLDEIQKVLLDEAQKAAEKLINEAKEQAQKIIDVAIDEAHHQELIFKNLIYDKICDVLIASKVWWRVIIGKLMKECKETVLKG